MDYLPPPPYVTQVAQHFGLESGGDSPLNALQTLHSSSSDYSKNLSAVRILSRSESGKDEATKASAKQIESLFIKQMMGSMRSAGAPLKSGLFGSSSEDIYQDMLEQSMSDDLSKSGFGLGAQIIPQLRRNMGLTARDPKGSMEVHKGPFKVPQRLPIPAAINLNRSAHAAHETREHFGASEDQQNALENLLDSIKSNVPDVSNQDPFVLNESSKVGVELHAPLEQIIQHHTFKSSGNAW